jgi:predicted HicB family RNase H-like nuclease
MSEEIRDIKDSISFLADTQRILSENILLQQQQFNEFQQILNASREESECRFNDFLEESRRNQQESERRLNDFLEEGRRNRQESERRFEASQTRLEAILLNQQRHIQLAEERIIKLEEQRLESDQRFNVTLQEIRHINQKVDEIKESQ